MPKETTGKLTCGASALDWVHSATVSLMKTLRFFSGTPNFSSAHTRSPALDALASPQHIPKALGADDN